MITLITIIILLACAVLAFFVLIQNPKGGGLSGSFGSMGNQIMGVKQSGDVMEKGTWYVMATVGLLCILSVAFFDKPRKVKAPAAAARQEQTTGAAQQGAGK